MTCLLFTGLNNVLREVAESIVECYKLAAAESSENFLSSNHYDTESFQLADFAEVSVPHLSLHAWVHHTQYSKG